MTSSSDSFSYCINPKCKDRQNPDYLDECQGCGMPLLINNRYRLFKILREPLEIYPTDIFEVEDSSLENYHLGTFKVLKVLKYNNSELVRLFQQEARALTWLEHPGIPKVEPGGYFTVSLPYSLKPLHCLIMEKIPGQNLAIWLEKNGKISSAEAANWLYQLTEILQKIHRQGLLHRDIKPSNIMLKDNGQLVLIDFGIVGSLERGQTMVGSYGYMAPEQVRGEAILSSDFFALGRTIVHLLTGRSPMDFNEERETGKLIWRESVPQIENWLADLIDNLMALNPKNRPADTETILHCLESGDRLPIFFDLPEVENQDLDGIKSKDSELSMSIMKSKSENFPKYKIKLFILIKSRYKIALLVIIGFVILGFIRTQIAVFFNNRGVENHLSSRLPNALYDYGMALIIDSNLAEAHYNLAIKYEDFQKFDQAQVEYQKAMQGGFIPAFNNQGRLYIKQGKYAEAIDLLLQGLKLVQNDREKYAFLKNLGWARLKQHRYAEAKVHLEEAISLFSDKAPAYCLLAQVLEAEGNKNSALLEWENCLRYALYRNPDEDEWINTARKRLTANSEKQ